MKATNNSQFPLKPNLSKILKQNESNSVSLVALEMKVNGTSERQNANLRSEAPRMT